MEQSQELRRYAALFLRWWWLVAICAALGAGAAYARGSRMAPLYTATATLLIQRGDAGSEAVGGSEPLALAHSQMLTGRPVMEAASARLGGALAPGALAGLIEIGQVPNTGLIRLSVRYVDPVQAAQIANAVAEAYVAHTELVQQGRYADYLNGVQAQMGEIAARIEETSTAIAALGTPVTDQEHADLARLETTLAGYRTTYAMLWNDYERMRLTAALSMDSVVLLERAEAPSAADGAGKMRDTLLAAVVGAMLAAGIVFLVEYLDDTIQTPGDVQAATGLDTLGVIGRMSDVEGDLVVADHPRSADSEAYRRLRTNVLSAGIGRSVHTLLVTSAGPGEGKSVTVANLAAAMAQAGLRVAVVDADLRRPRQGGLFNLAPSQGLAQSLLEGRLNGNFVPIERVEGLSVLPSGALPPNPAELLASARMRGLLGVLEARADVVLVDSPPLLAVTDAAILAQCVDGVLLVVQAGRTRRGEARQAAESLRQVNAPLLGAILNGAPLRGRPAYGACAPGRQDRVGQGRRPRVWEGAREDASQNQPDRGLGTEDRKARPLKTPGLGTRPLRAQELGAEAPEIEAPAAEGARMRPTKAEAGRTRPLNAQELRKEDLGTRPLRTEDLEVEDIDGPRPRAGRTSKPRAGAERGSGRRDARLGLPDRAEDKAQALAREFVQYARFLVRPDPRANGHKEGQE